MANAYISLNTRKQVADRANRCCEYCLSQVDYATEPFVVEHIVPISRGGSSNLANLAFACSGCNGHKYNKVTSTDPVTGGTVPLYNPRQHDWDEHFRWDEKFVRILGITPIGRTTVDALKLNRSGLVNLRQALYQLGKHPPL